MENSKIDKMQDAMRGAPQEGSVPDNAADAGRGTDNTLAHMTLGEVVLPLPLVSDNNLMQAVAQAFENAGLDVNQYTVGHETNNKNPETGYPEFGFLHKALTALGKVGIDLNHGLKGLRDTTESNAVLAGNYLLPGSAILTSQLASKGAQNNLNSPFGKIAQVGTGLAGAGVGQSLTGIPSASDVGYGYTNVANSLGGYVGAPTVGTDASNYISSIGDKVSNGVGSIKDALGFGNSSASSSPQFGSPAEQALVSNAKSVLGNAPSSNSLIGGGLGNSSSGGGSTFLNANSIVSALGGLQQNASLKKQQSQLLAGQNQQLSNLNNLNPADVQNDPGYQFNFDQGQQALNRQLNAGGKEFSGAALKAATEYGQNFANNYYDQAYQRQAGKVGAQNDIYGNSANVKANATGASSNNINQTLANALGANVGNYNGSTGNITNEQLLALLKQRGLA